MSVVARQSFKYSIIGYLGFLLGTIAAIWIFPQDLVYYGKLRFILPAAQMLMPIVIFGLSYSNVYFFGRAKEVGKEQNFIDGFYQFSYFFSRFLCFFLSFSGFSERFRSLEYEKADFAAYFGVVSFGGAQ